MAINKDKEAIELKVKELSKLSTAPDKETPDWMESDIRRGIIAGIELSASQNEELIKENEELKEGLDFANKAIKISLDCCSDKLAEERNKIAQLQSTIDEKNKEIERLGKLLDDIAKGEKMIVNRTGVGEYTVVFKGGEDVKKYYEDDFSNNL